MPQTSISCSDAPISGSTMRENGFHAPWAQVCRPRARAASMQNVTTSAVSAIRNIGSTIGEINEVTSAIASAVEQQGAATREIAQNIQHAASGTSEVSTNIVGVSQASAQAGTAASEVLNASSELRREADSLRAEVDAFLLNIRAA